MRQMEKVLWTKGVFLTPQHLQLQDRFLEDLVGFRTASLAFSPWGFARLEIDREALAGGSLAIAEASGSGSPAVTRRPAGVYTPETWQIDVLGADSATQLMLERALQGGGLA